MIEATTPSPSRNGTQAPVSVASGGAETSIRLHNVSKFYGEVLGINRVDLKLEPGITSLVGPNGSGKTTLMNLISGLLKPTRGEIEVLGVSTTQPEELLRLVGYCAQYDSFPAGMTGRQFVATFLRVGGYSSRAAAAMAEEALEWVGMTYAADRKIAAYSKGMRQRVKIAGAIAHRPRVLLLDEPLNGLDPMARSEVAVMFRELADAGHHVVVSSHILHEVDTLSDSVVLFNHGYVVAQGGIHDVREEMDAEHPIGVLVRCAEPSALAARLFAEEADHIVEARVHDDGLGLLARTRSAARFHAALSRFVLEGHELESVTPADDDVAAVYDYLITSDGAGS
jgi:ABC-2 type transport system ATP-binding protein